MKLKRVWCTIKSNQIILLGIGLCVLIWTIESIAHVVILYPKGHSLRPRFLTFVDSDFNDVAAVLKKMIGTLNTRNPYVVNQKSKRR